MSAPSADRRSILDLAPMSGQVRRPAISSYTPVSSADAAAMGRASVHATERAERGVQFTIGAILLLAASITAAVLVAES